MVVNVGRLVFKMVNTRRYLWDFLIQIRAQKYISFTRTRYVCLSFDGCAAYALLELLLLRTSTIFAELDLETEINPECRIRNRNLFSITEKFGQFFSQVRTCLLLQARRRLVVERFSF
jgi:hypothetical protein